MFKKFVVVLIILGISALCLSVVYLFKYPPLQFKIQPSPKVEVNVVAIERKTRTESLEAIGTAMASGCETRKANATLYVEKFYFKEGQAFKEGDKLVKLETKDEKSQYHHAKNQLTNAKKNFEHMACLVKQGELRQSEIATQKAQLENARLAFKRIQSVIAEKDITAPFDGVFGKPKVKEGALVFLGDDIVTLSCAQPIRVDFSVSKKYAQQINENQIFTANLMEMPDRMFIGKVVTIHPRVDEKTREMTIRGEINNEQLTLKPGMMLRISLPLVTRQVLTIPKNALLAQGKQNYIFILDQESSRAIKKDVRVLQIRKTTADINASIPAGAYVITEGAYTLNNGQEVTLKVAMQ